MPIIPPPTPSETNIFWDANEILDFARIEFNDVQGGLSGQDLSNDRPYTWPLLNLCYANLAAWLEDSNVESSTYEEAVVGGIGADPNASSDPSAQVRLGYDGCYYSNGAYDSKKKLPFDCLMPLEVSFRQTGTVTIFRSVKQHLGGLPQRTANWGPQFWEMRKNSLCLTGFTQIIDLKLRYIPALPLLVQPTVEPFVYPLVPLARCGPALAYMIAAEFAEIRNASNAVRLRQKANEQLDIISNRSSKRENQVDQRRRGYGFGRRRRLWL
jgi:hypothetical protein